MSLDERIAKDLALVFMPGKGGGVFSISQTGGKKSRCRGAKKKKGKDLWAVGEGART